MDPEDIGTSVNTENTTPTSAQKKKRNRQKSKGSAGKTPDGHNSAKPSGQSHGREERHYQGKRGESHRMDSRGQPRGYNQFQQRHGSPHQSPNRGGGGWGHMNLQSHNDYYPGPSSPQSITGNHSPVMYPQQSQSITGNHSPGMYPPQYPGGPNSPYSSPQPYGPYPQGPYCGPHPRSPFSSPQPHSPGVNEFFHGGQPYHGQGYEPRTDQGQGRSGKGDKGQKRGGERTPGKNQRGSTPNTPKERKQLFEPYMSMEDVSHGLKREELIQGLLRINPKNYEDCYVPHPDGLSDVYICGMSDRNRALNGDIVAVQIYPKEEWKVLEDYVNSHTEAMKAIDSLSLSTNQPTPKGTPQPNNNFKNGQAQHRTPTLNKDLAKVANTGSGQKSTPNQGLQGAQKPRAQNTPKKRFTNVKDYINQSEKEKVTKKLFADEDEKDSQAVEMKTKVDALPVHMLLRTGKIVAITDKKHSRACTGHIKLMNDKNQNCALFSSIDHRVPRMMIPMEDCPKDFYERPDDHSKTLFIARMTDWEEHSQYARGTLARSLGEAGEIEPETEGILISYGVDYSEFSEEVLACLPQKLPWRIPESEYEYRRDLRQECVFTIDPATARDLDDALHVIHLGDGIYEVGVHIADVSYFIDDETALDHLASQRSTSVYLVQKVIPMLPRLLCEELCSLNPGTDRLTFSVIWKMTEDGDILEEWFGRSVIRSCVKMSYEHAQGFIEEPEREWTTDELPPITGGFSVDTIKEKTLYLQKIAHYLRKKRFDDGALRLDQVKLSYTLDKDTGMPNGYYVYQQKDSNKLIEEFMLLANMAVSHKIYQAYPDIAVLRRHPPPQSRMMDDLVKTVRSLGLAIDVSSSKSIHESIQQAAGTSLEDMARVQILTVLCSKPMQNAKYFCTGCLEDEYEYRHYALNVPLYTHFTSPIRRYPDVMVHRLLAAALGYRAPPARPKNEVQQISDNGNDKKTNSKRVQELSGELFFAVFVKECGPLEEKGMVMGVLDKAFDILVLKLGVVKRVYCEKLPLKDYGCAKAHGRSQLTLVWKATEEHPHEIRQNISIFSQVDCVLSDCPDEPLKWMAVIKHPNDDDL